MSNISFWAGIIGGTAGIIGCIAGLLALYDRFWHRKPRLSIFAPYHFSGRDAVSGQPIYAIFLRIANNAKESAFLYLETMAVEIYSGNQWHKARRLEIEPSIKEITTDLPEHQQVTFGLAEAPFLSKFGSTLITFEQPLCGYIVVGYPDLKVLRGISKIKISVEDCHSHLHSTIIDLRRQSLRDPDRITNN